MAFLYDFNVSQKKTYSPTFAEEHHKPFELFSPQNQYDYSYAPNVQIDSPGATGSTITTKKEASSSLEQSKEIAPSVSQSDTEQQDLMTPILIMGGLAVVGYVAIRVLGKKKR